MKNKEITQEERRLEIQRKRVGWLFVCLGVLILLYGIFIK